jgi:hypothetical protein
MSRSWQNAIRGPVTLTRKLTNSKDTEALPTFSLFLSFFLTFHSLLFTQFFVVVSLVTFTARVGTSTSVGTVPSLRTGSLEN